MVKYDARFSKCCEVYEDSENVLNEKVGISMVVDSDNKSIDLI